MLDVNQLHDDNDDCTAEAYASVRETAKKFEHLMQLQLPIKQQQQQRNRHNLSHRTEHNIETAAVAPGQTNTTDQPTSVFYLSVSEAEVQPKPRLRRPRKQFRNEPDDDLLFDNLITDVNEYISGVHESTVDIISSDTKDDTCRTTKHLSLPTSSSTTTMPPTDKDSGPTTLINNYAVSPADKKLRMTSAACKRNGQRVVQEMLENERAYIGFLSSGIDNYVLAPESAERPDRTVLDQIYGNICAIRDFHESVFLPALVDSSADIEQLCRCFPKYIGDGHFYLYIEYAINRKRADTLFQEHESYFRRRQGEVNDPLGLKHFLIQPIQRLPKYQLLLYQLIQHLGTQLSRDDSDADYTDDEAKTDDDDEIEKHQHQSSSSSIKMKIASCCVAEKHIQRLLDRMNASMTISDIVDFQKHLDFLLRNIADNGEFQMVHEFDIHDIRPAGQPERYRGKLFLFDKCIVFTESLLLPTLDQKHALQRLRFRGFYQASHVGIAFAEGRNVFYLYHRWRGNQEIECTAESGETVRLWSEAIGRLMLRAEGLVQVKMPMARRS